MCFRAIFWHIFYSFFPTSLTVVNTHWLYDCSDLLLVCVLFNLILCFCHVTFVFSLIYNASIFVFTYEDYFEYTESCGSIQTKDWFFCFWKKCYCIFDKGYICLIHTWLWKKSISYQYQFWSMRYISTLFASFSKFLYRSCISWLNLVLVIAWFNYVNIINFIVSLLHNYAVVCYVKL